MICLEKYFFNQRRSAEYNRLVETGFRQQISAVLAKPLSAIKIISKEYVNLA